MSQEFTDEEAMVEDQGPGMTIGVPGTQKDQNLPHIKNYEVWKKDSNFFSEIVLSLF
jgi:hypothetical protein